MIDISDILNGQTEKRQEELNAGALVQKMEGGSMPLEETLAAYEKGVHLAKMLSEELNEAEKRMLELSGQQIKPMEDAP